MTRLLLLICLCLPLTAVAQEGLVDYRVDSEAWNGLASFADVARFVGVGVEARATVDLAQLEPQDVVVLVHPNESPDAEAVAAWVDDGGRLMLADDVGASDDVIEAFGLRRTPWTATHRPVLQDNPALPIVSPVGEHRLSSGVRTVVANHPAALRGDGRPVFEFEDGGGLLFDLSLGEGAAVFLSDPSALMNLMLPIGDNAVMARNIITYLCEGRPDCRLLVTRRVVGAAPGGSGLQPGTLDDIAQSVEQTVMRLRGAGVDPRALYWASLLLLVGLGVVLATVFPQATEGAGRSPVPAPTQQPASEFELSVRRLDGSQRGGSHMMPAAWMREGFDATFWRGMGMRRPEAGAPGERARRQAAEQWVRRFAPSLTGRASARRVREVERTLGRLSELPQRSAVMASMHAWLDAKELVSLHEAAMELLEAMEKDGDYRGRAQRPG